MTTLDDFIRQTIKAYLARTNMSAREFGVLALGDPGFVSSLQSGRSMRLDTADRLLQFMDEAPIGPKFRDEVEAFLSRTDMKPYKLGEKALGDPSYVDKLRSGASPLLRTVDRVRSWMHGTKRTSGSGTRRRTPSRERCLSPGRCPDVPLDAQGRGAAHALAPDARSLSRDRYRAPVLPVRATHRVRARRPPRLGVVEAREPRILNNGKPKRLGRPATRAANGSAESCACPAPDTERQ